MSREPERPGGTARRFTVEKTLGRGGFGTVYLATQHGEGGFAQKVALKVLNPDDPDSPPQIRRQRGDIEARLRDEARLLGSLSHPSIVRAIDLVWLAGSWTVVMEYADGASLQDLANAEVRVPPDLALEIAADVAAALEACWNQPGLDGQPLHLLHRDIKPANVLLTREGAVKVLDFGIAKARLADREGRTGSLGFGSMGYLPLEQVSGEAGATTDVFSLGICLWEMLVGERFARSILSERQHTRRIDEGLARLEPRLNDAAVLVRRMTAYDPEDRPSASDARKEARALARKFYATERTEWAAEIIPAVMKAREAVDGGVAPGTVLDDSGPTLGLERRSETELPRPLQAPAAGATSPGDATLLFRTRAVVLGGAGAALVGGALLLLVAIVAIWVWRDPSQDLAAADASAEPWPNATSATGSEEGTGSAVAPTAEGGGAAPAAEDAAGDLVIPKASSVTPRNSGATASSAPDRAATGKTSAPQASVPAEPNAEAPLASNAMGSDGAVVGLAGDASAARLVGGGGDHRLPATVPAGTYTVYATFDSTGEVVAGDVTVPATGTVTVRCQGAFKRCAGR